MSGRLRLTILALMLGLALTSCGRTVQEDQPEAVTSEIERQHDQAMGSAQNSELHSVMVTFRDSETQADVESAVAGARGTGYTDEQIAEAMGMAWLRAPQKRVLYSVVFVRFKNDSTTAHATLDTAYEMGRTPPAVREAEANQADDDDESEDEVEEPRERRGWFSWVPGL